MIIDVVKNVKKMGLSVCGGNFVWCFIKLIGYLLLNLDSGKSSGQLVIKNRRKQKSVTFLPAACL